MLTQEQIDELSLQEILDLEQKLKIAKELQTERTKKLLLEQVRKIAEDHGLTLAELIGDGQGAADTRKKVEPKYRHPSEPSLTWAGRGQKPKWLSSYLSEGGKLEDCKI